MKRTAVFSSTDHECQLLGLFWIIVIDWWTGQFRFSIVATVKTLTQMFALEGLPRTRFLLTVHCRSETVLDSNKNRRYHPLYEADGDSCSYRRWRPDHGPSYHRYDRPYHNNHYGGYIQRETLPRLRRILGWGARLLLTNKLTLTERVTLDRHSSILYHCRRSTTCCTLDRSIGHRRCIECCRDVS